jgi:hypothetical protein
MQVKRTRNVQFLNRILWLVFLVLIIFSDEIIQSLAEENEFIIKRNMILDKINFDNINYIIGRELEMRLDEYKKLGENIFQDLRSKAEGVKDQGEITSGNEGRIYAILQMNNIWSSDVIDYQLDHITLFIQKSDTDNYEDEQKSFPCKYGLKLRGWEVIPYIFEHISKTRNEKEMLMITELFVDICGRQMSKAILEVKKQENPPSAPENKIFNKYITFILEHIKK